MFPAKVYSDRRANLRKELSKGLVLFLGNQDSAFNYPANTYTFRLDGETAYDRRTGAECGD